MDPFSVSLSVLFFVLRQLRREGAKCLCLGLAFPSKLKQITSQSFVNGKQPILPSAGSQPYNVPFDPQPLVQLAKLQMRKLRLGELRALVLGEIPAMKNPRQPHDLLRMRGLYNLQKTSASSPM